MDIPLKSPWNSAEEHLLINRLFSESVLLPQVSPSVASKACITWLKEHGAVLSKESSPAEAAVECKSSANTLVMPAPVAVAHGDANLAIDDFLKSMT